MTGSALIHWPDSLIRACWQGGLVIALVWALCAFLPWISPGLRCRLWRLAYLKLLLALFMLPPICLPLLPPAPHRAAAAPLWTGQDGFLFERSGSDPRLERKQTSASRAWPFSPASCLLGLWLLGLAGCAVRIGLECREALRLKRRCLPERDPRVLATYAELCTLLGVRRAPDLLILQEAGSPVLLGGFAPAILLPSALRGACAPEELRLMLAHELAHLQRRDLVWGWLASIAHALCFFHPLVWVANREWRIAHELACDELALRITGAPVGDYGAALLKVAAQSRSTFRLGLAAVSADEFPQTLQRRLIAMKTFSTLQPSTRKRLLVGGALLTGLAALSLMPWRVVAQTGGPDKVVKSDSGDIIVFKQPQGDIDVEKRLQSLGQELNLSDAQMIQIRKILTDFMQQARAIKADPSAVPENREDRMQALRQSVEQQIKVVLMPKQQLKLGPLGIIQVFFPSRERVVTLSDIDSEVGQALVLLKQVGLTPAQTVRVKQILTTGRSQAFALLNNSTLPQEQRMIQLKQLHETVQLQLQALLTPEQREKLDIIKRNANANEVVARFKELGLTEAQQAQIKSMLADMSEQSQALMEDPSLSKPDKEAEMADLMESYQQRFQAVLTPVQFKKLQERGGIKPFIFLSRGEKAGTVRRVDSNIVDDNIEAKLRQLERLDLTDQQKISLKKIIAEGQARVGSIMENEALSKEQKGSQLQALHQTVEQQILAILTPQQRQNLTAPVQKP